MTTKSVIYIVFSSIVSFHQLKNAILLNLTITMIALEVIGGGELLSQEQFKGTVLCDV